MFQNLPDGAHHCLGWVFLREVLVCATNRDHLVGDPEVNNYTGDKMEYA